MEKKELTKMIAETNELKIAYSIALHKLKERVFAERTCYEMPFLQEKKQQLNDGIFAPSEVFPHSVSIFDKYDYRSDLFIYKAEWSNGHIFVTGYSEGHFDETNYIYDEDDNVQSVMDFILEVLTVEKKQQRTFKKGEKLYYMTDNVADENIWVSAIEEKSVNSADEKINVADESGTQMTVKAGDLYKTDTDKNCPLCNGKSLPVCINHKDTDESWYCPSCQENFYRNNLND